MLTEEQIKATIVQRMMVADESCSSRLLDCIEAQIRALVYALGDGERPPLFCGDAKAVCDAAGIPYIHHRDGSIEWTDEWLESHGFEINGDTARHPRFGIGW